MILNVFEIQFSCQESPLRSTTFHFYTAKIFLGASKSYVSLKTSILGRVLPRRANFIERAKGICHRILYAVAYVIV